MDVTIKATPEEVVLRIGAGSVHVTRFDEVDALVKVFAPGGTEITSCFVDGTLIDALCVLVGEAHYGG